MTNETTVNDLPELPKGYHWEVTREEPRHTTHNHVLIPSHLVIRIVHKRIEWENEESATQSKDSWIRRIFPFLPGRTKTTTTTKRTLKPRTETVAYKRLIDLEYGEKDAYGPIVTDCAEWPEITKALLQKSAQIVFDMWQDKRQALEEINAQYARENKLMRDVNAAAESDE